MTRLLSVFFLGVAVGILFFGSAPIISITLDHDSSLASDSLMIENGPNEWAPSCEVIITVASEIMFAYAVDIADGGDCILLTPGTYNFGRNEVSNGKDVNMR